MRQRPSTTALAVTVGLLLDARDPLVAPLFPPLMSELAEHGVAEFSPRGQRILRFLDRSWYRGLMRRVERVTMPGIFLHYLMRKLFIEDAVRSALAEPSAGAWQVVVIGAGLDTLGSRLALEGTVQDGVVIEVDHPLTQSVKRRALARYARQPTNLELVELDLTVRPLDAALRASSSFDSRLPTVFVAEGLLMYLTAEQVVSFFRALHDLAGPGSRIVFTFMESERSDRVRFKNLSRWYAPLFDLWLRRAGEPMQWAIDRRRLGDWLAPSGWTLEEIADRETFRARYLKSAELRERPLADGEYVAVARRIP
jgi:methyltransferase (TIGR00027 family)